MNIAIKILKKQLKVYEDYEQHAKNLSMNENMGVSGRAKMRNEANKFAHWIRDTKKAIEVLEMELIARPDNRELFTVIRNKNV